MSAPTSLDRLFDLLPAVYREGDARPDGAPGFLKSLLEVIGAQRDLVQGDLDQLYDDLFIETCDAWVVPYIGDLVAVTPGAPVDDDAVLTRAAVANAIALRRRKGTAAVLEQLARDYTGWPVVAVEMFQRMAVAQHLQHVTPARGSTASLRSAAALEQVGRSFDSMAHTLEVRRIGDGRGRYDVQNVAVMVWRDQPLTRTWGDASGVDGQRFRFSPLGWDQALATQPQTELALAHQATSLNVPGPVSRRAMAAAPDLYFGPGLSVAVRRPGDPGPIAVTDLVVCDLADHRSGGGWSNVARLGADQVAVDPQLGRLAFGTPQTQAPLVSFVTTAPSDTGGGEARERPSAPDGSVTVKVARSGVGGVATTVTAGLLAAGSSGTVEIGDTPTYRENLTVSVPAATQLRVVSPRGAFPVIDLVDAWTVTVGERGVLTLVGLVIGGGPLVIRGRPDRVDIVDCTFVPGQRPAVGADVTPPVGPSIVLDVDSDWQTELTLTNCITGPLLLPADGSTVSITDSIVDGLGDGLGRAAAIGTPARLIPVLRSPAALPAVLALAPGSTTLRLTLGTDPSQLVSLSTIPVDGPGAAAALDAALAGTGARAFATSDRVVVVGDGRALSVTAEAGSGLAAGLGLVGTPAQVRAVLGGPADLAAAAAGGTLTVTDRSGTDATVQLAAGAADLDQLAQGLQTAVQFAGGSVAGVLVSHLDGALIAIPSTPAAVTFAPAAGDFTMVAALGLASARPAIAADPSGGYGATLTLARSTVLGAVNVQAIDTITDSIITGVLTSDRRQIGCIEYSWIDPASRTARQHECQPATTSTPPPRFVSRRFATAGYGRLRRPGASAVIRAASDGYEMGALARLRQTQRDDNLRRAIEEFLRFGLEAGVLDGT